MNLSRKICSGFTVINSKLKIYHFSGISLNKSSVRSQIKSTMLDTA